jgi:hypothetical protein
MALAYFITFSTYGTWLHGTSKGLGSVDRKHNHYGAPFVEPNTERETNERDALTQPSYTMDAAQRQVVCDAIVALCQERGWDLSALHVRGNHVHAVVAVDRDPGRVMSDMKARASRALTNAGFDDATRKRWTRHGSTLHLFDDVSVADKIDYTLNRQGTPMASYDGRTPKRHVSSLAFHRKDRYVGKNIRPNALCRSCLGRDRAVVSECHRADIAADVFRAGDRRRWKARGGCNRLCVTLEKWVYFQTERGVRTRWGVHDGGCSAVPGRNGRGRQTHVHADRISAGYRHRGLVRSLRG